MSLPIPGGPNQNQPRYPPYPGGTPNTPTTGGSGGGSSGASANTGVTVPTSNGGVFAQSRLVLYPCQNLITGDMEYFSFSPLVAPNDPFNPSFYFWRVEQISPYRNFTVRRFIWTFTDLGQVYVIWTLSGVNENQQVVQTTNAVGVGNAVPTYKIFSIALDFGPLSMMNQQLSVYRAANAGPLSVVQMYGSLELEENTL